MNTQLYSAQKLRSKMVGFFAVCMVVGIAMSLTPSVSMAQSGDPAAGTTIGNQASATYVDNNGNTQTVTSNSVETTVQQVAAVTVSSGITQTVSPGGTAVFQHTITNNGNGSDTFDLSTIASSNNFSFTNIQIFEDANQDGSADDLNSPITSTISIAAGNTYTVVVRADVPTGATDGQSETVDVTATSQFDGNVSTTVQNTATVSENAVVTLNKSLDTNSGDVGNQVTVTLNYNNTGTSDATNLTISDPLPAGFDYVSGSAQVNSSGVTDGNDGDSFTYDGSGNGGDGLITVDVGTFSPGQSGSITFDVQVATGTEGQTISNTGELNHDDLSTSQTTAPANFTVNEDYSVTDAGTSTVSKGPVAQGSAVEFVNTFKNNGSSADTYNIVLSNTANYPSGTSFQLYASDGSGNKAGLLGDTNGDSTPDTGPVSPGSEVQVIVHVQLPSGASGAGPYNLTKTATSVNDPSTSVQVTDQITDITANTVDVTNNQAVNGSAPGEGINPTGENSPVTTNTTNPGTTTSFTLFINNTSSVADTYNLAASTDNTFGSITLPAGWSVEFQDSGGNPITSTGSIASGSNMEVTAVVTVPAGADYSAPQSIYFQAQSSSGASDVKHDAVDVNAVRSLTLVSDQTGTVSAGGSITYTHTLTNTGNVVENDGTNSTLQLDLSNSETSGFPTKVFYDADGSGTINSGDPQVTTASNGAAVLPSGVGALQNGDQIQLIVQVQPGANVADGTSNTTTLSTSDDGSGQSVGGTGTGTLNVSVNDVTTIQAGDLAINKSQRIQGSGNPYGTANLNADPGEVIEYQIVVTNQGSAPVNTVNVTDNIPSYTTQDGTVSASSGSVSPSVDNEPGDGNTGPIEVSVGSLAPGESFTIEFAVQIDS
ncbi:conserved repeat domain-containing protein [Fodinibius salinus]|uniref:Conserved repeat domain-containing protein n=1 Tax=Fodinibius salinus TaxID=860790 RepID=A0A5D3YK63_9BACT|nr:DUF11 domain-containing protein [Fodinibius salinus]TYP93830.1 conserved repeat domain-containing protein [Fodinibius salinus]